MRQLEPERRLKGKKRSFRDNFGNSDLEKNAMKTQLRVVQDKVDKKKRGVTNSLAAYEGIIPDAPSNSFKMKRNKSKGDGGRGQESPVKKQGKKSSSPSAKKHRK